MIDPIGFPDADYARSRAFHVAAPARLGFDPVMHLTREQTGGYEGTRLGPPGRPHYHANYYGAFVFDPDGHRLEAVCHQPEP